MVSIASVCQCNANRLQERPENAALRQLEPFCRNRAAQNRLPCGFARVKHDRSKFSGKVPRAFKIGVPLSPFRSPIRRSLATIFS
jgi:hypothetical protein